MEKKILRGLSMGFIDCIMKSELFKFYKSHTDELFLGIRNEYVNIYYKGGSICKVTVKNGEIVCKIADKYIDTNCSSGYQNIDVETLIEKYNTIKCNVCSLASSEKKSQQTLILNNNSNPLSKWFCVDMEYVKQRNSIKSKVFGRFDIIAVSKQAPYRVALIELKYGIGAIGGQSGIVKHADDFMNFIEEEVFENHLIDEIVAIINSLDYLKINIPFKNIKKQDFCTIPKFFFISLANKNNVVRECIKKYVLNNANSSTTNIQKEIGVDITKENERNFTPVFLFSDEGGNEIFDIIEDCSYDKKGLVI